VTDQAAIRAARQTRRDHCRGCSTDTLHPFAGWVTSDGRENTIRPRAYYRTCRDCGLLVMVLDDVTDVDGLARAVLDKHLRPHGGAATAIGKPVGPPPLDWDACLNHLIHAAWHLYERSWNPNYGDGRVTFRGYATHKMQLELAVWIRDETGDASSSGRKRRVYPKAHAPSVSGSLDSLLEYAAVDDGEVDRSPVAAALGGRAGDAADDRSPDLAWALEARSR
jgi:hypothetical protein